MRIMIVDDERVSRVKMNMIMKHFGACDLVENGEQAVAAFIKAWEGWNPYRVITLDISLPDITGLDVLLQIRGMEDEKGVPDEFKSKIIMVTSHKDKDSISDSITAGCNNYVIKPFNHEVMKDKLHKLGLV
ncbi:response regulator [Limisalsivibrio acetivorans]|uniref:response regulator n=1 Tax=Limisalsivibrio acetivorans TaxID=1304888 RepID=UPI0003B62BCF|nr:response regulator [Limisalsivibrio acetivorans]